MNLKKILVGITGVAVAGLTAATLVLPTAATSVGTIYVGSNPTTDAEKLLVSIPYTEWHDYTKLTIHITDHRGELPAAEEGDYEYGAWVNANGVIGYNDPNGDWNDTTKWDPDSGDITINLLDDVLRYEPADDGNAINIQFYWAGSGNWYVEQQKNAGIEVDGWVPEADTPICDISYTLSGVYAAPVEETTEAPVEETTTTAAEAEETTAAEGEAEETTAAEAEAEETTTAAADDTTTTPDDSATAEPVLINLTGDPVMKNDGGLRVNFSHPWGGDEDNIIDWADIEGTQVVSVKFQVTGITSRDVNQAYLNISNFNDDINYWGPTDSSNNNVSQVPVTIAGDGVYVATVELDVPYTATDLNFLALQTDIQPDANDEDLVNCPQIAIIAVAVDAPLTVADGEVPVYPENTDDGTSAETTQGDVTPDDGDAAATTTTAAPVTTDEPATGGSTGEGNPPTGIVFAVIPAIAAAAGVVISKKRK